MGEGEGVAARLWGWDTLPGPCLPQSPSLSEAVCLPYTCSGAPSPAPTGVRGVSCLSEPPQGPKLAQLRVATCLGYLSVCPTEGLGLGAKGHPLHTRPLPVTWKLPCRLLAMFSLHGREGAAGWRPSRGTSAFLPA